MLKKMARYLLKEEISEKDAEIKTLKQTLGFRHTTINDLRYKVRVLENKISETNDNDVSNKLQQSSRVAQKIRMSA